MTFFRTLPLASLALLGIAAPATHAQYGYTKIAETGGASPAGGTFSFIDRPSISGGKFPSSPTIRAERERKASSPTRAREARFKPS